VDVKFRAKQPESKKLKNKRRKRYDKKYPEKIKAVRAVWRAIKRGVLVKSNACESCGLEADRIEGHHEDYSKLLDVMWLCVPCHATITLRSKSCSS
jgi:hypothetical protein